MKIKLFLSMSFIFSGLLQGIVELDWKKREHFLEGRRQFLEFTEEQRLVLLGDFYRLVHCVGCNGGCTCLHGFQHRAEADPRMGHEENLRRLEAAYMKLDGTEEFLQGARRQLSLEEEQAALGEGFYLAVILRLFDKGDQLR